MSFKDQVVWITGASSGIGEALTYELSRRGAKVIISARRKDELERVRSACENKDDILVLPLDLARSSEFQNKVRLAREAFGRIDVLINNGGISQRSHAMETKSEVDRKIMEINYFGTVELTKEVLPEMISRKSGHIVVVTSVVGILATPVRTGYSASKHALHGYFDALRAELFDDGIHVTLVCPGYIRTNISINALSGSGEKNLKMDEATNKGMAPDTFAKKMLRAVAKKKKEVYIGGIKEVGGIYLKRFFPGLAAKMLTRVKVT